MAGEYGTYLATKRIYIDYSLAFNVGDWVPVSHITNGIVSLSDVQLASGTPVPSVDVFDARVANLVATDTSTHTALVAFFASGGGGTVPDATATGKGIVELATTAETTTGTDTVRAVTPAGVAAAVSAGVASAVATVGALIVVHGTNTAMARPSTTGPVIWFGTGEPDNADDTKDIFVPVTTGS